MKVAIIGGGFVGLAAGVELVDRKAEVVIFEADKKLGGLAGGFKPKGWKWSLEKFYHHIFANDEAIKKMAERVGWPAFLKDPKTMTFKNGVMAELDSPLALLRYKQLSLWGRVRMAMGLAVLKIIMWPQLGVMFEKYRVVELLPGLVGGEGYKKIWEPLLLAKFGGQVKEVNMAWFWARIVKRTKKLGYFKAGFAKLGEKMAVYIKKKGGEIKLETPVKEIKLIEKDDKEVVMVNGQIFDEVIVTVPAPIAERLIKGLRFPRIGYLWGQTLVLELKESLMESYWLNILERDWPFLVVVEQTKLINKSNYGGKTVVYIGNYLEDGDKRLEMDEKQLLQLFMPYLQKIKRGFKKQAVSRMWKFQAPYAQPVFPVNYSQKLAGVWSGMTKVHVTNMSMVYPWDRGTNYAVELGVKVAEAALR